MSVWLDWVTLGPGDSEGNPSSGYEADSLIPFMAYLGIGLSLALLYATMRADRRQHRGLSLASMAAGLASLLWCVSFLLDPISTTQSNQNVSTEIGPYIALLGSLLWTVGSFSLAKEPEGDHEPTRGTQARALTRTRPAQTAHVEHHDVHTTGTASGTGARTFDTTDQHDVQGVHRPGATRASTTPADEPAPPIARHPGAMLPGAGLLCARPTRRGTLAARR